MKINWGAVATAATLAAYGIGVAVWGGSMSTRMDNVDKTLDQLSSRINIERSVNMERDIRDNRRELIELAEALDQRVDSISVKTTSDLQRALQDINDRFKFVEQDNRNQWEEINRSPTFADLDDAIQHLQQQIDQFSQ